MSQAHIDLGGNRAVVLEPALRSLRLWPAVAGAKLELRLKASVTGESKEPLQLQVSAKLPVGTGLSPSISSVPLCLLQARNMVQPSSQATEFTLEGLVSAEQLRAAEQPRGSRPLWLIVSVRLAYLDRTAELQLAERTGDLSWNLPTSEWAEELERVEAAGFVEVLVPMAGSPKFAKAVSRLGKARALVRDDRPEQAVGETRKALEQYRKEYGTLQVGQAAATKWQGVGKRRIGHPLPSLRCGAPI
jgi:hypothetical protein